MTAGILRNLAANWPPKGKLSVDTKAWRPFLTTTAAILRNLAANWPPKGKLSVHTKASRCSLKMTAGILRNLAANWPPKGKLSVHTKASRCIWRWRPQFCEIWPRIGLQRESFQSTLRLQGVSEDDGRNFAKFGRELASKGKAFSPH